MLVKSKNKFLEISFNFFFIFLCFYLFSFLCCLFIVFVVLFFSEGNNFFKAKDYRNAIIKYSEAIEADPTDVTFFSNRRLITLSLCHSLFLSSLYSLLHYSTHSNYFYFLFYFSACYAALEDWENAAEDGKQCIIINRSFVKGYFRAGLAYQNMGNLEAALDVVKRGLGVESTNADLKRMSREIEEAMRIRRVDAAIESANKLLAANEINDAYKTVDAALRLDPNNSTLNGLMDRIRPKYERAEKARVAGLDRNERMKEEGDTKFKNADFEGAIAAYTRCIESLRDDVSLLLIFSMLINLFIYLYICI